MQVVKTVWPEYNRTTSQYRAPSADLSRDPETGRIFWTKESWSGGRIEVLEEGAPLKDTVLVPVGGYLVARFKADNPG
jgi:hypothetical protein